MNVLITGITGSGGSYLAESIIANHPRVNVSGICRWHSTTTDVNIRNFGNKVNIYECDLNDLGSVIRTLQSVKPDRIFHLAAYANVRKAFDTPLSVIQNNVMGTANLLEAIRMVCPCTLLQMCSTSEVYGNPLYTPIDENHPVQPVNPYSVSKLTQESLCYAYYKSWGLNIIITRMFTYINPRRADLFATAFARQIVNIENGKQEFLLHGNLDSIRTIIDVRDAMESYWAACNDCKSGEPYNIGGKETVVVGEFLELLKSRAKTKITSKADQSLFRPVDITKQIPDSTKFYNITQWRPKYSLEESIDFLLDYWRNKNESFSIRK